MNTTVEMMVVTVTPMTQLVIEKLDMYHIHVLWYQNYLQMAEMNKLNFIINILSLLISRGCLNCQG